MKNLSKLFACVGLALCLTFGLTACTPGEVEENTRTAVETTASIIPVEYTQVTAEGILHNALYTLLSSSEVEMNEKSYSATGAVGYEETTFCQKVMINDGKRYVLLTDVLNNESTEYVIGTYNNKQCLLNLDVKKYVEIPVAEEGDGDGEGEGAVEIIVAPLITRLDMISSLVSMISDKVVSGRYFDGATYINIQPYEGISMEAKIVDGKIVTIESFGNNPDDSSECMWGVYTFTYGSSVDVSMIPTSLNGFTLDA